MARCASLPRNAIEMVEIEQDLLLSPSRLNRAADEQEPMDFFVAIRDLIETKIHPNDIQRYTKSRRDRRRDHRQGAFDAFLEGTAGQQQKGALDPLGVLDSSTDVSKEVAQARQTRTQTLETENGFLRGRVAELELALQQAQEHSHHLLSEVETALDAANGELRATRDAAARDHSLQATRARADAAAARAKSEAALAHLREEFRLFRDKAAAEAAEAAEAMAAATAASGGEDTALLTRAQENLAAERLRFSAFQREVEEERRLQEDQVREKSQALEAKVEAAVEAAVAAATAAAEASLAKEREDSRILRERAATASGQTAALETALAKEHEDSRLLREKVIAASGQTAAAEAALAKEREDSRILREKIIAACGQTAAAEASLAKEREDSRILREKVAANAGGERAEAARIRSLQETLKAERQQLAVCKQAAAASQQEREADAEARLQQAYAEAEARLQQAQAEAEARLQQVNAENASREAAAAAAINAAAEAKVAAAEAALAKEREGSASHVAAAVEAALAKEREMFSASRENSSRLQGALKRAEEALAAERARFSASKRASEAKIQLLRREAMRVEELEAQLASKGLRLKQKEAEARALASDGNVISGLRESLTCKDNALNELRQEMSSLRMASAASAVTATAQQISVAKQQQQHLDNSATSGENALARVVPQPHQFKSSPAETEDTFDFDFGAASHVGATAADMIHTMSISSAESVGEELRLGAIEEGWGEGAEDGVSADDDDSEQELEMEELPSESEVEEDNEEEEEGEGEVEEEGEFSEESDLEGGGKLPGGKMSIVLEGEEDEDEDEGEGEESDGYTDEMEEQDAMSSSGGSDGGVEVSGDDETGDDEELVLPEAVTGGSPDSPPPKRQGQRQGQEPLKLGEDDVADGQQADESFAAAKFLTAEEAAAKAATAAALFEEDEDEEDEDEGHLDGAGSHRAAIGRTSTGGGRRLSMSYSLSPGPGPRRSLALRARASLAPGSKSLSPVRRRLERSRASWSPCAPLLPNAPALPSSGCLSPMARLAPADHGMGGEGNVVVLELGAWRVRAGVVSRDNGHGGGGGQLSYFDDFPCCVARPLRDGADLDELVNGASSLAAPMYSKFRKTGVFVGGDAWYCCLDHPSIALRSKLRLSCPLQHGQRPTREDTDRLADHAYSLLMQDAASAPTLLTYKPTATLEEVLERASLLLETHSVPAIRVENEARLIALAVGVSTGVVVDIGESGLSVTPIYGGCPVASAVQSESCGGADVTKFLDYMLLSRTNEQFNQMTDRRRLEYTREIKEAQCYVPLDFDMEVDEYGAFKRKAMRVCKGAKASPMLKDYEACDSRDFRDEADKDEPLTKTQMFTLKSGNELEVQIGLERFHAPEILFKPGLWKEGGVSRSVAKVVFDALHELDSDTRAEVLEDIVVVGGSAHLDGLGDRLEEELKALLPEWMSDRVDVRVPAADELKHRNPLSRGVPSAVTVGAEMLLLNEHEGCTEGDDWITATAWAETPERLTQALVPFLSGDSTCKSPRG